MPKTQKREIDAFVEAADELKCTDCLLITWDEEKIITEQNIEIKVIPAWKWLLESFNLE
jgi:predicted AAA+ superfamily ATPase